MKLCLVALLLASVAVAGGSAYAQGGGASSTGTIQGVSRIHTVPRSPA
jgi:hypothetical protein